MDTAPGPQESVEQPPRAQHPSTAALLQYFDYEHLPARLRLISRPFHYLAHLMASGLTGAELTAGLRHLLQAKDCMVRAALPGHTVTRSPQIGDMVLAIVDPATNNGTDEAPAIITRVFTDALVNVRILVDTGAVPPCKTSVWLYATREDVDASTNPSHAVFWPPRA